MISRTAPLSALAFAVSLTLTGAAMADADLSCLSAAEQFELAGIAETVDAGPLQTVAHLTAPQTADALFPIITENDQIAAWMPGLAGGTYDDRPEGAHIAPGMTRRLTFGGRPDVERIVAVDPPRLFAYQIVGGVPIEGHLAVLVVKELGAGQTLISWYQYFRSSRIGGILQRRQVRRFIDSGMTALATQLGGTRTEQC